jgi:hypothetical protein
VVKYLVNDGFSHPPVRGKNYRFTGPLIVTFTQTEDPRTGDKVDHLLDAARNPPNGAIIDYFLRQAPESEIRLTFLDSSGAEIRGFSSRDPVAEAPTEQDKAQARKKKEPRIPKEEGLNRWVWNLRYPDATKIEDDDVANEMVQGGIPGPQVSPGTYRVRLSVGEETYEQAFEVRQDPRVSATDEDLRAQFDLLKQVHQRLSDTHAAINQIRALRRRAMDWMARTKDKPELESVEKAARALLDRLKPVEEELVQVNAKSRSEILNYPIRLNGKLAALLVTTASADAAPTAASYAVAEDLSTRVQTQLDQLSEILATEVAFLNQSIANAHLPPVGT